MIIERQRSARMKIRHAAGDAIGRIVTWTAYTLGALFVVLAWLLILGAAYMLFQGFLWWFRH